MRLAILLALILSSTFVTATIGTKSDPHAPTFVNVFTRFYMKSVNITEVLSYNFTINYTKVPRVLQGITPQIPRPQDMQNDTVTTGRVRLDPRTCPNDLAQCYQIRENNNTKRLTPGSNYTSASTYLLPQRYIRNFVCIGDDVECVESALSCRCPSYEVPQPPVVWGQNLKCSDTTHICLSSFGSFKLCEGNLSKCQAQYNVCGCGRYAACATSMRNACVNERNELVMCTSTMPDCLAKYKTCYCGDSMLYLPKTCETRMHKCEKDGKAYTCYGAFEGCALEADKCEC